MMGRRGDGSNGTPCRPPAVTSATDRRFYGQKRQVPSAGKATVWRQRVRSACAPRQTPGSPSEALAPALRDRHWRIAPTERDAPVLENNLFRERQLPFNVRCQGRQDYP